MSPSCMKPDIKPKIINAEGVSDGVIVLFDDGRCALYNASLLLDTFARAKEVIVFGVYEDEETLVG